MERSWSASVDNYCERLGPEFWAEPVNALTNLSFVAACLFGFWLWRRDGGRDGGVLALSALAGAIGAGSFLFHTVATRWAAAADVLPIALFILVGIVLAARRLAGLGAFAAAGAAIAYQAAAVAVPLAWSAVRPPGPDPLNGSAGYLPALAALVLLGLRGRMRDVPGWRPVLAAAAVFTVSLVFRSIDQRVCEATPFGTHFLWHLLNGLVLALCIRGVAEAGRSQR